MLGPEEIYLPVIATGILFTGGVFFALAARELKLPIFKVGSLLFLIAFLHAAFDSATIAAGPLAGERMLSFQLYRLEQVFLAWLLPTALHFVRYLIAVPRGARHFHRALLRLSILFSTGVTITAFVAPDLFISVTAENPLAETVRAYWGHGAQGPLFHVRDGLMGAGLLYILGLVLWVSGSSTYRLRESAWLTGALLIAAALGGLELAGVAVGAEGGAKARLDHSLIGLSLFAMAAMADTVRSFLSQVKAGQESRSELSEKQKALEQYIYFDLLTGLPNREALYRDVEERLEQGAEHAKAGLVFMDIDDFQGLNESLGIATVDRLVSQLARIVRNVESTAVTAYRTGTDEFALLIRGAKSAEGPAALAAQIQSTLLRGFYVDGQRHSCGVSAGVLMIPEDGEDIHTISKNGFSAIRRAKQQGNAIMTYDESMRLDAERRMRLVSDLRQSVGREDFYMLYQSLVDPKGVTTGAEALLRWRHPRGDEVSPGRFVAAAEGAGLMQQLGNRGLDVLREDLRSLLAMESDIEVSFNLSAQQFGEPDFCKRLAGELGETGYPLSKIVVEITESAFVERINRALKGLEYLHSLGFRIAMDDFGTGYSSLSYLRDLPIDRLKVDRSFVERLPSDDRSEALLRVIRETCTAFGLEMVVEGVEREEQHRLLERIGPDFYQGFYFSRPARLDHLVGSRLDPGLTV